MHPPPRWGSVSSSLPGALVDRSRLVRDIALGTVVVGLECICTDDPNRLGRLLLKCYAICSGTQRGLVCVQISLWKFARTLRLRCHRETLCMSLVDRLLTVATDVPKGACVFGTLVSTLFV